jgi:hypothetical protein
MLTPKKVIPSLAVAILALTGCGSTTDAPGGSGGSGGAAGTGGSGGSGGTGGSIPEGLANSLRGWCMNYVDTCGFTYYGSVDECVSEIFEYYSQFIPNIDDPSCQAALMSYLDCGAALSCQELDMLNNSCDDQYYASAEPCGF